MRLLLVQAFTAVDMELVYPIGLASLAAHLPGHEVALFDVNLFRERPFEALEAEIHRFRPDVVGFSLRNMKVGMPHLHTDDIEPQRRALAAIRRAAPEVTLIGGGTAFSLYSEPLMRRLPELDLGVWGEAEHRLPALLETLDHPEGIPGVWYRVGDDVRHTADPGPVDVATLERPRRDLLSLAPYAKSSPVSIGVQTKRGCALRCLHCSDTFLTGTRVRMRPPALVADEIEELVTEHGIREIFFCDQQFNIPPAHAKAVCEEIVRRRLDIRWSAWFNEHHAALPEDLLVWLRRAGCHLLSFSPDAADDRILRRLDKNFRTPDLFETYRLAKKHGFEVEYSFFLNAPGEDLASLGRILLFLARARLHLGSDLRLFTLLLLQPIRLYPHTRLHDLAVEAGIIQPDDDLIEGRYWNPGPMRHVVTAVQEGAKALYRAKKAIGR